MCSLPKWLGRALRGQGAGHSVPAAMSLDGGNHGLRIALLAGILLIVLPTVTFGGVSILSLLIGDPTYMQNPWRQDLWRAVSLHIWRYQTIEALTASEIHGLPSL